LIEREQLEEGILLLRLNRPDRLNAITPALITELHSQLDEADSDRSCRIVILTGTGRGFCAGADLKGTDPEAPLPFQTQPGTVGVFQHQELYSRTTARLRSLAKPVIAAVNGPATGGGLAFVLGCDIRIAAQSAQFSAAFVRIGLSGCDMGTSWLLNRLVGAGRAHELMLTGRIIDAQEALRIGLVVDVVPDEKLIEKAVETAHLVTRNSPFGIYMTKQVMWSTLEIPGLDAAINLENRTQVLTTTTADFTEAGLAFRERRAPHFGDS